MNENQSAVFFRARRLSAAEKYSPLFLLFRPRGRIARLPWWVGRGYALVSIIFLFRLMRLIDPDDGAFAPVCSIVLFRLLVLSCDIKRLRDIGWSWGGQLFFNGVFAVSSILYCPLLLSFDFLSLALSFAGGLLGIAAFVALGLTAGEPTERG